MTKTTKNEAVSNNKSLIFTISESGSVGKSLCATMIGDLLRTYGHETAIYSLDNLATSRHTYDRLCEKDEGGNPLLEQDPVKGVKIIDILNQESDTEIKKEDNREAIDEFINTISLPYENIIYDFPASSVSFVDSIFESSKEINGEVIASQLERALKSTKKDVFVVIPVNDLKAVGSVPMIAKLFSFDNASLNNRTKFIVLFNNKDNLVNFQYKDFLANEEINKVKAKLGERLILDFQIKNIDRFSEVLQGIPNEPFTNFYDQDEDEAIVPEGSSVNPTFLQFAMEGLIKSFRPLVKNVLIGRKN